MECAAGSWYRCRKPPTSDRRFSLRVRWERAAPVLWQGFILGNVRIWILYALYCAVFAVSTNLTAMHCARLIVTSSQVLHRPLHHVVAAYHMPRMAAKMILGASSLTFLVLSILQSRSLPTGPPGNSAALTSRQFLCVRIQWLRIVSGNAWAFVEFSCDVNAFCTRCLWH